MEAIIGNLHLRKNRLEALSPLDIGGSLKKNDNLNQLFKANQLMNREPNTPLDCKNSQFGEVTPRAQNNGSLFKNVNARQDNSQMQLNED